MAGIIQTILSKLTDPAADRNALPENEAQNAGTAPNGQINAPGNIRDSQNPVSAVKYPAKPSGLPDDYYEWLINGGYKPETISEVFNPNYNPAEEGGFMTSRIAKLKPQKLDEKKIDQARTAASVTDAVGILAQMFAAGRGARIKERDASQLAMSRFANEEKALRDLYRQQKDRYNDQWLSASASDFNRSYSQHQANINAIRDSLNRKREFDHRAGQEAITRQQQEERFKLQRDEFEETKRRSRAADKQRSIEAATRYFTSVQKNSDKSLPIQVDANPSDPDAVTNKFGKKVRLYDLTQNEYEDLLAEAKRKAVSDPSWADKHSGVLIEKPMVSLGGDVKGSYKFNDRALVKAYAKELYDANFQVNDTSPQSNGKFPQGTEDVLKNPNLPIEKKIEWLKSNHKLSDREIMNVLISRGLFLGSVPEVTARIGTGASDKEENTGGKGINIDW